MRSGLLSPPVPLISGGDRLLLALLRERLEVLAASHAWIPDLLARFGLRVSFLTIMTQALGGFLTIMTQGS